jgi:zinc transporter ZupT
MTYIILIASVLIGILIVFGLKPGNKTTQLLLSFSGAYLLSITILHLLPEVFHDHVHLHSIGLFILLGLLIQLILDFFSRGAEHGHLHVDKNESLPVALFFSLCVHAFMEGLPLGHSHDHEHLLWAIVVHKIPIAIILGTFLVKSGMSKFKAIAILIVFALMSPLGSFAGSSIQFLIQYRTEITAIIIGVLLHISTIILFESSKDHKFNLLKFATIILGMVIAYLA